MHCNVLTPLYIVYGFLYFYRLAMFTLAFSKGPELRHLHIRVHQWHQSWSPSSPSPLSLISHLSEIDFIRTWYLWGLLFVFLQRVTESNRSNAFPRMIVWPGQPHHHAGHPHRHRDGHHSWSQVTITSLESHWSIPDPLLVVFFLPNRPQF